MRASSGFSFLNTCSVTAGSAIGNGDPVNDGGGFWYSFWVVVGVWALMAVIGAASVAIAVRIGRVLSK